jgi:quercetin dioxygenase-like cupin family protein
MKILVFLHGTTIMHRGAMGHSREERVRQVRMGEESVREYATYVPIGNAVEKLQHWHNQGAEIIYLGSHRNPGHVEKDRVVLNSYGFPAGEVIFRQGQQTYKDVAESVLPDVLIEDDCESIGGEVEMVYPHIAPSLQRQITSIVVREFEGIDHLPDSAAELLHASHRGAIHRLDRSENGELRWHGVLVRAYAPQNSGADRATRQILIGTDENSPHFHMRYFAVQPGGHSSLDQHAHDHGVYVLHGSARLRLGDNECEIGTGDVIYIPGNEVHQFFTLGDEPFGFLCVVPAKR